MVLCVKTLGHATCSESISNRDSLGYSCGNASDVLVTYVCWSVRDSIHVCNLCENSSAQILVKSYEVIKWVSAPSFDITTNWICENTNDSLTVSCGATTLESHYDWSFLFVALFILAGGLGNILVCLAIAWERRLQNITNYFLLSLAVADLLVSLFVMPMGAIQGFLGNFKFNYIF